VLCLLVIYCLVFNVVQLPGHQGIFILNVLLSDTGTSVIAVIRGLGIQSKRFVGVTDDNENTWFCYVYGLVSRFFWNSALSVLLPLTIDRFLAIVFPFKHKLWITPTSSIILITLSWIPATTMVSYRTVILYYMGNGQMDYMEEYHRCGLVQYRTEGFEISNKVFAALAIEMPMAVIVLLYTIMAISVLKSGRSIKKIMRVSSVVVFTGCLAAIPDSLFARVDVTMSYEIAQVFTVTFWYLNCVVDPFVYFYSNPAIRRFVANLFQ